MIQFLLSKGRTTFILHFHICMPSPVSERPERATLTMTQRVSLVDDAFSRQLARSERLLWFSHGLPSQFIMWFKHA